MSRTHTNSAIGLVVFLLLPFLVLLAVGLHLLRQDKVAAHTEAVAQAQRLADALVAQGFKALEDAGLRREGTSFQVDASGRLLVPSPTRKLFPQPLLSSKLDSEQSRLWQQARALEADRNRTAAALVAYQEFLSSRPPPAFEANAKYSIGLMLAAADRKTEAAAQFQKLANDHPEALTESGLPMRHLALLKLFSCQTTELESARLSTLDLLCSNLVFQPTPLSPALLREAAKNAPGSMERVLQGWKHRWEQDEKARTLHALALSGFTADAVWPRAFWIPRSGSTNATRNPEQTWLVFRWATESGGRWHVAFTERETADLLRAAVPQLVPSRDYLDFELILHEKTVAPLSTPGVDRTAGLLASARKEEGGDEWLRANVYLAFPDLLYAQQQKRRFWIGALIGVSALAAMLGMAATWRGLRQQQRVNELKTNFVSSVSHELRTPVAAVQLLIEGLESGKITGAAKQQEYFRLMRQECRRLAALIDNVLDFSRLEQGRKEFEFKQTEVVELLEQTVKLIEPFAEDQKVPLEVTVCGRGPGTPRPLAMWDRAGIQQAMLNLIDNAIKHSPEGERVRVGLEWSSGTASNGTVPEVSLWVEDRGPGIPAAEHERIFEQFYRRGSELRRETQGVGIGLTLVRHIAESHGGRVVLRSAPGEGSRFTLQLPLDARPKR